MRRLTERALRREGRLFDPTTKGGLKRGSRRLRPRSDRTDTASSGYLDKDGQSPKRPSISGITGHACVRIPSPAVDPIHGARRQQALSSPPAAADALRAHGSQTVRGQLCLGLGPPRVPSAPPRPGHTPAVPAGRRAPLQRRLPATPGTVGTTTPELETRAVSPSIYPGSAPTAGWGRGHAGAGPARDGSGAGLTTQPASSATWWPGSVGEAPA